MKFIATSELGRLCKWMRILGYDTVYTPDEDRRALVLQSLREERIILTRDSKMSRFSGTGMIHVRDDLVEDQIRQVIEELGIKPDRGKFFTICVLCNKPLEAIAKEDVRDKVPPYVYKTQDSFVRCGICDRIYWQGTHWTNVGDFVERIERGA